MRNTREINGKFRFTSNLEEKPLKLKLTCEKQEEMLPMIEGSVRRGIRQMSGMQHARAFKGSDEKTYLWYLDANNFYEWAMIQTLLSVGLM